MRRKSRLAAEDRRLIIDLAQCVSWFHMTVYAPEGRRIRGAREVYHSRFVPQIDADERRSQHTGILQHNRSSVRTSACTDSYRVKPGSGVFTLDLPQYEQEQGGGDAGQHHEVNIPVGAGRRADKVTEREHA